MLQDVDYDFTAEDEVEEGPFYQRKVKRLRLSNPIVPSLKGR